MYWRAFDKAEDLDAKLGVVSRLTELYLQRNQLDRLLDAAPAPGARRRRPGARPARSSATWRSAWPRPTPPRATWAAPAPSSSGCWPPTPATPSCSSSSRSWPRKRATSRAPPAIRSSSTSWPPATRARRGWRSSTARYGELEEAQAVWSKMAVGQERGVPHLQGDRQPARQQEAAARARDHRVDAPQGPARLGGALSPGRWPWPSSSKPDEAARGSAPCSTCTSRRREERSRQGAQPRPQAPGRRRAAHRRLRRQVSARRWRTGSAMIYQIRMACKLENRESISARRPSGGLGAGRLRPGADGRAGLAASAWPDKARSGRSDEVVAPVPQGGRENAGRPPALWDWFYLCSTALRQCRGVYAAGRRCSRAAPADPLALWAYLYSLGGRQAAAGPADTSSPGSPELEDNTPPLDKAELDHVLACYRVAASAGVPSWPRPRSFRTSPTS